VPWAPAFEGELPTLGWVCLDWVRSHLVVPDGATAGAPLVYTREQAQFILNFYRVKADFDGVIIRGSQLINAREIRRAILSRAKGWGKSPVLASVALFEAFGPALLDGWDANGRPVGREWASLGFKAKSQIIATSEDQTSNTWEPLLDMVRGGDIINWPGVEALDTFVRGPRVRVEFTTSSANSREGGRPVFASLDQTESWVESNGGRRLAAAVRRNLAKTQGTSIESPNAYRPGDESVAEGSFKSYARQKAGKTRSQGILLDHREAPPETDPEDADSMMAGLAHAYGDSAGERGGWVNLERIADDFWDPDTEPQDARMYYFNQVTHAATAWLTHVEWAARYQPDSPVGDGDIITLGFDGSRRRARGIVDATALVGCHVPTGYVWEIKVWEQPDGKQGKGWEVPRPEVHAAVRMAFDRWRVVGFFADPAKWENDVAGWEATWGRRLPVKATQEHPIEWWMTGGRLGQIVKAVEAAEEAVRGGSMSHDGSFALTQHALNARRKETPSGITIAKEHPDSRRKIDAAVAMVLALWARKGAVAKGFDKPRAKKKAFGF
jgi:hypothetical protein